MNFEQAVQEQMAAGKSRGQATLTVARERPDLHQEYLDRINSAMPEAAGKKPTKFEEIVAGFMREGLSRGQATKKASYDFPAEHQAYIDAVNGGMSADHQAGAFDADAEFTRLIGTGMNRREAIRKILTANPRARFKDVLVLPEDRA